LDEQHQKYKFMERNLVAKRRRLKNQIPDITSSLAMIKKLKSKSDEGEETEAQFLLSDQVYAKATIPPTKKVRNASEIPRLLCAEFNFPSLL
jgi:prefoldin subunit 5